MRKVVKDRVLRHLSKFFVDSRESDLFWNGLFTLFQRKDFECSSYYLETGFEGQRPIQFRIAKLCNGMANIISLADGNHYLWVGKFESDEVAEIYQFIRTKIDGTSHDGSNSFLLLDHFLRFKFNRRSTNAMLNALLAFFLQFKDDIVTNAQKLDSITADVTEQMIFDNCTELMMFIQKEVLLFMLDKAEYAALIRESEKKFPYSYSTDVTIETQDESFAMKLPSLIHVGSFTELPDAVIKMAVHRELDHIVNDYFGRDESDLVLDMGSDSSHFLCTDSNGKVILKATIEMNHSVEVEFKPSCFETVRKESRCFLFDGLDIVSSIYVKVEGLESNECRIQVDLRLLTTHKLDERQGIKVYAQGVVDGDQLNVDSLRVEDPQYEWLLYSTEIEKLVSRYVVDQVHTFGCDMVGRYNTIYIRERNIIQSSDEILNLR